MSLRDDVQKLRQVETQRLQAHGITEYFNLGPEHTTLDGKFTAEQLITIAESMLWLKQLSIVREYLDIDEAEVPKGAV